MGGEIVCQPSHTSRRRFGSRFSARISVTASMSRQESEASAPEGQYLPLPYAASSFDVLLSTFATTYSRALQETLFLMGSAVVDTMPGIAEVRFAAPNKHHFLVDFSDFDVDGLENNGEVFIAADRPYGLIECTVLRESPG